jgi:c-di-GMP-binding flagellar brake protein YcgR
MSLQPIPFDEVPIGTPLPWPVYDREGHLLFERGRAVISRQLLEKRGKGGVFVDLDASVEALQTMAGFTEPVEARERPGSEMFPPAGIQPQIWDRMQMRLPSREAQKYLFTRLVGYVQGVSILVTLPREDEHWVAVTEGDEVEVRTLTGNNIYVFRSEVLRVSLMPSPYLHLRYPEKVQHQQLRRAPWAKVSLPVVAHRGDGTRGEGFITNLSACGGHLVMHGDLGQEGEVLRLAFQASNGELMTELVLEAVVRRAARSQEEGEEGLLEYGVEFRHLNPSDNLWLKCMVYQRISEGFLT